MTTAETDSGATACETPSSIPPASSCSSISPASPSLNCKILKQIEFYFGDNNFPRDKFLSQHVKDNDGWANLSTVASFSRIKKMSEDLDLIVNALKDSEMIELNKDNTKIRRKSQVNNVQNLLDCTVYAKGFPIHATLDELEEYFSSISNQVKYIRFRREPKTKAFKGSVFVELATKEEADRIASLETIQVKDDMPITVMTKLQYFEKKNNEKMNRNGRKGASSTDTKREIPAADLEQVIKNSLLVFEGVVPTDLSYKDLKTAISQKYEIAFAEVEDGHAIVRLKDQKAEEALEFYQSNPSSLGPLFTFDAIRLATEEEKEDFLENFTETVAEMNKRQNERKKRGSFKRGKFVKRQKRADKNEEEDSIEQKE